MNRQCRQPDYSAMIEREMGATGRHHPRHKFSEGLLDNTKILSRLEIIPGQTILDAGCGNGYMSKEFSRLLGNTGKVYALDIDEIAIAELRRETEGTNILTMVGDITTTTDLPACMMDLVYVSTVFHCFSSEQIKGFETEVKRVLKPDGKLAIIEIAKRRTPFGPPLNMRFSPEELKRVLGLAPLATVDVGKHFYMQLFKNRTSV